MMEYDGLLALDRLERAVEKVRHRLLRSTAALDMFLDGPDAKARDAVHVIFSGQKVRPEDSTHTGVLLPS